MLPSSSVVPQSSWTTVSPSLAVPAVPVSRGSKAAQEFEAQLLGSLLEGLESSFASLPGPDSMPGADNYNYMGREALASALAASGGFGLAAMITKHINLNEGSK